jgi:hypothetical protein
MWLHRESQAVLDLQLTVENKVHTRFYLENSSTEITFKNLSAYVCACACLRACVYEGMMLNCTIKKLVGKLGSVPWIC